MNEPKELRRYARNLARTGMPEREQARDYFYAQHFGLEALTPADDGCVTFEEPTCGDWNCIKPGHQVLQVAS